MEKETSHMTYFLILYSLFLIPYSLTSLLRPQPTFGNFITAGQQIILVTAGDEFFIGQLHPPSAGFLALQKNGLYFGECHMIFVEGIPFIDLRFPPAAAAPIQQVPEHVTDLFGSEFISV